MYLYVNKKFHLNSVISKIKDRDISQGLLLSEEL